MTVRASIKAALRGLLLFNAGALLCFVLIWPRQQPSLQLHLDEKQGTCLPCRCDENERSNGRVAEPLLRSLGTSHRHTEANCERLFAGDTAEQAKAQALMKSHEVPSDHRLDERFAASDCLTVRQSFITETLSQEEADFPIAFSLVVFKDFYQVEKLFRAMYRPEHFYCFHVDSKSSKAFHQAVVRYSSCFPNVVVPEKRCDIQWGRFSVLDADLTCMEKLLGMSSRWRYFINLTGQEFPLRTMRELVRILKALNGSNNLENAGPHSGTPPLSVKLPNGTKHAIQWYKGSVHITVTRGFVEYAFSSVGRQIIDHLRTHGGWPCPDETFFATLNFNAHVLKVPGADLTGLRTDNVKQPFLNRYKNWLIVMTRTFAHPCLSGKGIRQICIWGMKDLPAMNKRPEFFVNKFYYNFQRVALQCMVERFWNNTMADYGVSGVRKSHEVPLKFYTKFDFVRQHL